jgi:hypothetical protein
MPHNDYLNPVFYIKRGDTAPDLEVFLRDADNQPVAIGGATVRFIMAPVGGGAFINRLVTIVDPAAARVKNVWQAGDTATAGDYVAEFQVTFAGGAVQSFPNNRHIKVVIYPDLA